MNNLIDGRQKKSLRLLEIILSTIGWICLIVFFIQVLLLFIDAYIPKSKFLNMFNLFGTPPVQVQQIVLISILCVLLCVFILNVWRSYNLERFGHLNRRKFSSNVTVNEISSYFGLAIPEIEKMQNEKWIELEKTIV